MREDSQGFFLERRAGQYGFVVVERFLRHPYQQLARKFKTKRTATAFLSMLQGDALAAKRWYALTVKERIKDAHAHRTPAEAWAATKHDAWLLGLGPAAVGADPDTGEPFPLDDDVNSASIAPIQ